MFARRHPIKIEIKMEEDSFVYNIHYTNFNAKKAIL